MSTAKRLHYTYDDYLQALESSEIKLEFCDGVIYAMAGGTATHAALGAAMVRILGVALLGRCGVYSSDLKVRIEASDMTTFPDASVVCGERRDADIDRHALTNPTLLVEVTSRSTEDYDRGDKLSHYKQLESLRVVLVVSHRSRRLTAIVRASDGRWEEREYRAGERVILTEPEIDFAVDEVYQGIELEPA